MDAATAYQVPAEYEAAGRCRDLPELVDVFDGEVALGMPDGGLDRIAAAVASRRRCGARLEQKIDGAWAMLAIGAGGIVESVTSRSGRPLKALDSWLGERCHHIVSGWRIIGEAEAYTSASLTTRDPDDLPLVWVHSAFDRRGRPVDHDRLLRVLRRGLHRRLAPIPECPWSASWADWTRAVIESGGEGVVVKLASGESYRAKPRRTEDRVVARVYREADHNGAMTRKADLGVYSAGRLHTTQAVVIPKGMTKAVRPGRVVVVVGPSVSTDGVVRHGRIVEVRASDDKQPAECTL